ncbi:zinc ribbon domain-containing protein [Rhizomonospora bruguierae]|uniref:zinc ribbon domain-containing protein n=1 Tax=Rhizomonospora bruguierae TaxID=1581705 RepID=UPI001BCC0D20|nr:zinc ribbon domain-containing protein [Micromonospora sp. NBRC 107566]
MARYDIPWIDQETFPLDQFPQGFPLLVDEVLSVGTPADEGVVGDREWVHVLGTVLDPVTGQRLSLGAGLWQLRLMVPTDQPRSTVLPPLVPEHSLHFRPVAVGAVGRPESSVMINMVGQRFLLDGLLVCGLHDAPMTPYQDGGRNRFYACSTMRCIVGLVPATLVENLAWIELTTIDGRLTPTPLEQRPEALTRAVSWVEVDASVGELRVHVPAAAGTTIVAAGPPR